MALGWKYLIEFAILWVLITAAIQVGHDQGWPTLPTVLITVAIAGAAYGVLFLAMPKSGEPIEEFH
jgi:hypothetical protein